MKFNMSNFFENSHICAVARIRIVQITQPSPLLHIRTVLLIFLPTNLFDSFSFIREHSGPDSIKYGTCSPCWYKTAFGSTTVHTSTGFSYVLPLDDDDRAIVHTCNRPRMTCPSSARCCCESSCFLRHFFLQISCCDILHRWSGV